MPETPPSVEPAGPGERVVELIRIGLFVVAVGVFPAWFLLAAAIDTLSSHPDEAAQCQGLPPDACAEELLGGTTTQRFFAAGKASAVGIGLLGLAALPLVGGWMVWQRWRRPKEAHAADLLGDDLVHGARFEVSLRPDGVQALRTGIVPGPVDEAEDTWEGDAVTDADLAPPPPPAPPPRAPDTFVDGDDDDDVDDLFRRQ
ncbi:MAG: hypothetical protein H6733_05320 [Alphaproteobacteria bacterium]|nr:hypothetical protein [Alphaproteobacteria bacterium]